MLRLHNWTGTEMAVRSLLRAEMGFFATRSFASLRMTGALGLRPQCFSPLHKCIMGHQGGLSICARGPVRRGCFELIDYAKVG